MDQLKEFEQTAQSFHGEIGQSTKKDQSRWYPDLPENKKKPRMILVIAILGFLVVVSMIVLVYTFISKKKSNPQPSVSRTEQSKNIKVKHPDEITVGESQEVLERVKKITSLLQANSSEELKDLAMLWRGDDTDDARHIIQVFRITYLRAALLDYKKVKGVFPESLDMLQEAYPTIRESCKTQRDCLLSNLSPEEQIVITDMYTGTIYPYKAFGDDFELQYELSECTAQFQCENSTEIFVVGTNTLMSYDFSKEKPSKTDEEIKRPAFSNEDSDGDLISDYHETYTYKTDTKLTDSDQDGLRDGEEVLTYQTNPNKIDSDGDGFNDKAEIDGKYNPNGAGRFWDGWSACITLDTERINTCEQYCTSVGMECKEKGISTIGKTPAGSEAWESLQACQTGEPSAGSTVCNVQDIDASRGWRCFCE